MERSFDSSVMGRERRKQWRGFGGSPKGTEKRKYQRVPRNLPICYSPFRTDFLVSKKVKSVNISTSGIMLPIPYLVAESSLIELEIFLPRSPIVKAIGEVRWQRKVSRGDMPHQGVRFLHMQDSDRERIANYIYK